MNFLQKNRRPILSACLALLFGASYFLSHTPTVTTLKGDVKSVATHMQPTTVEKNSMTNSGINARERITNAGIYAGAVNNDSRIETGDDDAREAAEKKSVGDRWKLEFDMTKDPTTGQVPRGMHFQAVEAAKKVNKLQLFSEQTGDGLITRTLPTIAITVRGPNNYGGRTRTLGFDVRNTQIVLAGGISSGIFRSTDGGATWTNVTPLNEIHNVTALAQDTRAGNENIWYYGTGESADGSSAGVTGAPYLGNGIWKSTDNGLTWLPLPSTQMNLYSFDSQFDYISRIIVDPHNGVVLAGTSEAIARSNDGGTTWATVLGTPNTSLPPDIIYNNASKMCYASLQGVGVYSSADDGVTWKQIATAEKLHAGGVNRIVLSNVANTPNILAFYEAKTATACNGGTNNAGLQLFDAATSTWADHSSQIGICAAGASNPKVLGFQEGYNMCVTTKPDDANIVFLGATEVYRLNLATGDYQYIGGDQGSANATNLHVDNHLLIFEPGSNTTMWAGNDGGMRKTDVTGTITPGPTGGYNWTDRNTGYITYQYYGADINPTSGSDFIGGAAQDNAFTLQPSTAQALEIGGGDGTFFGIISGTDFKTYHAIAATQNGILNRILNGAFFAITPTGQKQGFKTVALLDADNTNFMYYPTDSKKLYRTHNASAMEDGTIGDVAKGWEDITGVAATISGEISAMTTSRNVGFSNHAYTASDVNRKMYIGTDDGKVYRMTDPAFEPVASKPVEITPVGSKGFVSSMAVNPNNDKEILVTYSNYNTPSVWHTADATAATPVWENVEGPAGSAVELASARSSMIVDAGSKPLYIVGTSTGLYGTQTLSGATTVWERIGAKEIALSPSVSMRLRTSDNHMVLGTHGNGLFMLTFPQTSTPVSNLNLDAPTVSVFPNPSNSNVVNLDLTFNKTGDIVFEFTDIAGRRRLTSQQKISQGHSQIAVDISTLENGLYLVTAHNAGNDEVLNTIRFVKQ